MIRVIDLGKELDQFALFDTVTGKFLEFENEQAWDNSDDFYEATLYVNDDRIGRIFSILEGTRFYKIIIK